MKSLPGVQPTFKKTRYLRISLQTLRASVRHAAVDVTPSAQPLGGSAHPHPPEPQRFGAIDLS
jgi:hypothetical protein